LVSQTLQGDFLLPDTNPFLQGTFDRAADAVQNRLETQFAGSGRNIGASAPAARDQLSGLANQIFGGNFQAERDRQIQSLFAGQQFNPLDVFIRRLSQIAPGAGRDVRTTSSGETEEKASPLDRALDILDIF
jgi:hypothetical protein